MSLHSKAQKLSYKTLFLIIVFLLIPIILLLRINQKATPAVAGWFNDAWSYRKAVSITNSVGTTLTDFQVSISIGTSALINSGKMKTDCSDLRVTDVNGKLLPHWIEENNPGCNAATDTKVWIKVPNIPSSGGTVYIYYGNPSATNIGDVTKTFGPLQKLSLGATYSVSSAPSGDYPDTGGKQLTNGLIRENIYNSTEATVGWIADPTDVTVNLPKNSIVSSFKIYAGGGGDGGINIPTSITMQSSLDNSTFTTVGSGNGYSNTEQWITVNSTNKRYSKYVKFSFVRNTWLMLGEVEIYGYPGANIIATDPSSSLSATEEQSKAPVAYWSFDEGVGTTVYDASSSKLNGAIDSGMSWKDESMCVSGKCLYFDGVNNNGIVIRNVPIFTPSDNWSVSFWAKIDPSQTWWQNAIYLKDGANYAILAAHGGNTPYFYNGSPTQYYPGSAISFSNDWKFYTVSRQGSVINWYINGSLNKSTNGFAPTLNTGTTWNIGYNYSNRFKGFLDEIKVYRYARSAAEIKADYAAGEAHTKSDKGSSSNLGTNPKSSEAFSDGLVGYWKMDEGTGATVADSSGNGNAGSLGTGDSAPGWVSGMYGIGLSFDGINNSVTTNLHVSTLNSKTFAAWVYPNSNRTWDMLVMDAKAFDSNKYSGIIGYGQSLRMFQSYGASSTFSLQEDGSGSLVAGKWVYVVGTIDKPTGTMRLYINGVKVKESVQDMSGVSFYDTTNTVKIGGGNGGYTFNGKMDEVRIYNRALSATEVKQLYEYAPGPVAYYKFDEGVGSTAFDSSGFGNNGSWSGTGNHWTTGKFGKAGSFNGSDDNINAGTGSNLNITGPITISGWLKYVSLTPAYNTRILQKGTDSYSVYQGQNSGKIMFGDDSGFIKTTNDYNDNNWHFFSAVHDGANIFTGLSIYIDGVKATTTNVGTFNGWTSSIANPLYIGDSPSLIQKYNGLIDEVKIYNYARTQKQIVEDMLGSPKPVGGGGNAGQPALVHYKFDEGYGTTVHNNGNGGIGLSGAISGATWTTNGKFGKALTFSGTNRIAITDTTNSPLDLTTDMTLSAWVYRTGSPSSQARIISKGDLYLLYTVSDNKVNCYASTLNGLQLTATSALPLNTWTHIACTFGNGKRQLYINGILNNSDSPTGSISTDDNELTIGNYRSPGTGYIFQGSIDEVKIYNYALTSDEVKLDYNQGKAIVMGSLGGQPAGTGNTSASNAASQEYCIPGDASTCSAPIARWDFEEGVGTSAYDSSGNGNNGGLSGPTWVTGKIGKALNFNGINNSVNAGNAASLSLTNAVTLEAWVKYTFNGSINSDYFPIQKSGNYWFWNGWGSPHVYFEVWVDGARRNPSSWVLSSNVWYHLAGTYDSSTRQIQLFVNGVKVRETTLTGLAQYTMDTAINNPLVIGSAAQSKSSIIDQVRIYNYARTPAQIAYDYNQGAPIAQWKFDECQGNIAHDSIGTNNGTISIGASGAQNIIGTCALGAGSSSAWGIGATGKINSSLSFDGNDDKIVTSSFSLSTNLSVCFWAKPNSSSLKEMVIHGTASNGAFEFYQNGTSAVLRGGSTTSVTGAGALSIGNWSHICGVISDTNGTIYSNGKYSNSGAVTAPKTASGAVGIGAYIDGQYSFNGQIDDVQIYNYALTAQQIKTLYSGGSVNFR